MCTNISGCIDLGIIILDLLNRTPFWAVSSSRYTQYSLTITGTSSLVSGQPDRMVDFKTCRAMSCTVCCCICLSLLPMTFRKSVWLMLSISSSNSVCPQMLKILSPDVASLVGICGRAALESVSAKYISLPLL